MLQDILTSLVEPLWQTGRYGTQISGHLKDQHDSNLLHAC